MDTPIRDGLRSGLPLVIPTAALGVSFGVLAKPIMGAVAPVVMSVLVFSGGAQFAALGVLQASGTGATAIVAGCRGPRHSRRSLRACRPWRRQLRSGRDDRGDARPRGVLGLGHPGRRPV